MEFAMTGGSVIVKESGDKERASAISENMCFPNKKDVDIFFKYSYLLSFKINNMKLYFR
jgi:hypothetical protein